MMTKDVFHNGDRWQLAKDEVSNGATRMAWEEGISSRYLKAGILGAMVIAFGTATLLVGNPVKLFAGVAASLADKSPLQPGIDQPMPTIQRAAEVNESVKTKSLPLPTAKAEKAAATTEGGQRPSAADDHEVLFRQFRAWVAEREAQANIRPARDGPEESIQSAAPSDTGNGRAGLRPRTSTLRHLKNARAEMRSHHPRKKIRREQEARAQVPPEQTSQLQGQPVQNDQAFPFLQLFGSH